MSGRCLTPGGELGVERVRGLFLTAVALECVLLAAESIEVLLVGVLWLGLWMVFRLKVVLLVGVPWLGLWMVDLFVGVLFPFFPIVRGGALFLLRVRGG